MTSPLGKTNPAPVRCETLQSEAGLEVDVVDFGASIAAIRVPVDERSVNVVLTYPDLDDYRSNAYCLGATVGRYANRIANGRFRLAGSDVELVTHPTHCLHGGPGGFHMQRWEMVASSSSIRCRYVSLHLDQGFPGRLDVQVDYRFLTDSALLIEYTATSDHATVVNLANHAYFNLNGDGESVADHTLRLNASHCTLADNDLIPTGQIDRVEGTRLDFQRPQRLRERLGDEGIDTNFVIDGEAGCLRKAATLHSSASGILLSVRTTQPGLQVYSSEHLGEPFAARSAICLEAQNFPDAPNQPAFPTAVLDVGETYHQQTVYEFVVRRT